MSEGIENANFVMEKELIYSETWKKANRHGRIVPEMINKDKVIPSISAVKVDVEEEEKESGSEIEDLDEVTDKKNNKEKHQKHHHKKSPHRHRHHADPDFWNRSHDNDADDDADDADDADDNQYEEHNNVTMYVVIILIVMSIIAAVLYRNTLSAKLNR